MLLLDNSAWSRVVAGGLSDDRAETVAGWLGQCQLAICLLFLLEAGYSARASADYQAMMDEFNLLFPRFEMAAATEDQALVAQRELAARGHRCLAPIDVMIAACAHETGGGVLHYDLIAEHTSLSWLAPAGTLWAVPDSGAMQHDAECCGASRRPPIGKRLSRLNLYRNGSSSCYSSD